MRFLIWFKEACEYTGGVLDEPPRGWKLPLTSPLWGVWWAILLALILVFSGQTSKFLYIDF